MDFQTTLQILTAAVAATSVMTFCSYAVSAAAREIYKEPLLLTYVLSKLHQQISPKLKLVLGWVLHYLIGLFFVIGYHIIWSANILDFTFTSSLILGIVSGIIGISGWVVLFRISAQKPNIDYKGYYIQLFVVHVIFAVIAYVVYELFL